MNDSQEGEPGEKGEAAIGQQGGKGGEGGRGGEGEPVGEGGKGGHGGSGAPGVIGPQGPRGELSNRWRTVFTIWLIIFSGITFYAVRANRQLGTQGAQARQAICAFKIDLAQRLKNSEQFLKNNPNGIPNLATPATIRTSIINQQSALTALDKLRCKQGDK